MHYWISYCARQALGVQQPQAKGPQGLEGVQLVYNNSSLLANILVIISSKLGYLAVKGSNDIYFTA